MQKRVEKIIKGTFMRKFHPLNSLSVKLFLLITLVILSIIALMTWQNGKTYEISLSKNFKQQSLAAVNNSSNLISKEIKRVEENIDNIIKSIDKNSAKNSVEITSHYFKNNQNWISFQLFEEGNAQELKAQVIIFNPNSDSIYYESHLPKTVHSKINKKSSLFLSNRIKWYANNNVHVWSMARLLKLPVYSIAKKITGNDRKTVYWGIVTLWQNEIMSSLKASKQSQHYILDRQGRYFSSNHFNEITEKKSLRSLEIFKNAEKSNHREGFIEKFFDTSGKVLMGAFATIPAYKITIVYQQEKSHIVNTVKKLVVKNIKWGIVFFLIAILIVFLNSSSLADNLSGLRDSVAQISTGNYETPIPSRSRDELGQISSYINNMIVEFRLHEKHEKDKAWIDHEWKTSAAVKNILFPKNSQRVNYLNIAGHSIPATEYNGDWWGHFSCGNKLHYVIIADAAGHGVAASLVTAMAYSFCNTIAHQMRTEQKESYTPNILLKEFNEMLCEPKQNNVTMTMFAILLDLENNKMTIANAGHQHPILIPKLSNDPRIKKRRKSLQKVSLRSPINLSQSGSILGYKTNSQYEINEYDLSPGDKIILFSDGIVSCKNPEGQRWGQNLLLQSILKTIDTPVDDMVDRIRIDALTFVENEPLEDDLTIVCLEIPEKSIFGDHG